MKRFSLRTTTIAALLLVVIFGLIWGRSLPWHLSLELASTAGGLADSSANWQVEGNAFSVALLLLLASWGGLWLVRLGWRIFVAPVFLAGWFRGARQKRRASRRLQALEDTARLTLAGEYEKARSTAQTAAELAESPRSLARSPTAPAGSHIAPAGSQSAKTSSP